MRDRRTEPAQDQPPTLSAMVLRELRARLIVGQLLPGDAISIRTLAAESGTSTMPVREALGQLAAEKALSGAAKRAYRVPNLTRLQAANLFEIRAMLEGGAAAAATPHITARDIAALRRWTAVMEGALPVRDAPAFLDANFRFHALIYSRSGNRDLCDLIENLLVRTGPWLAQGIMALACGADWQGEHDAIIAALEAGDASRARALIEEDARWGMTYFREAGTVRTAMKPARKSL